MYLDYKKLKFDKDGLPEAPDLMLETLHGEKIGIIPGVSNLHFDIKLSEPSEISFDVAGIVDGKENYIFKRLTGYKLIYTEEYGIYQILNPSLNLDGVSDKKSIKGYSIEKTLEKRKFYLEEGTYNLWNPASPEDTLLGMVCEIADDWSVGYVSQTLIGEYRTFEEYSDYLLSFLYKDMTDLFRCVVVFNPYQKKINLYDADEERPVLPIYLDFDNLLKSADVNEVSDELVTALAPYGADDLSIRAVNPTGSEWIYDLTWALGGAGTPGDIPSETASRWKSWQNSITTAEHEYQNLQMCRSVTLAELNLEQSRLVTLQNELKGLDIERNAQIQAVTQETDHARQENTGIPQIGSIDQQGIDAAQQKLRDITRSFENKKGEIDAQEKKIKIISDEYDKYKNDIDTLQNNLNFKTTTILTDADRKILKHYIIEGTLTEDTFVASDISDSTLTGKSYTLSKCQVEIGVGQNVKIDEITYANSDRHFYTIKNGIAKITYDVDSETGRTLSGSVIRGVLERTHNTNPTEFTLSLYLADVNDNGTHHPTGNLTLTGTMKGFHPDDNEIIEVKDFVISNMKDTDTRPSGRTGIPKADEIVQGVMADALITYQCTKLQFDAEGANMFFTTTISDFQKYSVEQDLYEYAKGILKDKATPTYEFSVESANFLFNKEFKPFRESLELGSRVYLKFGDNRPTIKPCLIEFEIDFEDISSFKLMFSNRFKLHDYVASLKDMVENSYSSGKSFDAGKYMYNKTVGQASQVSQFMQSSLDAAKNSIIAADNQSVTIDGAGFHAKGDDKTELRIINNMIAMTEDGWNTAKLAIGKFSPKGGSTYFGINAEVIGGNLIVGNNLIIENKSNTQNGQPEIMQFKVDETGAWLHNSTFILTKENGGKIMIDPRYGIAAGKDDLFTSNGTTVVPSFIDENGKIIYDENEKGSLQDIKIPKNTNFYLDLNDGNAYFRGDVNATGGRISGLLQVGGKNTSDYVFINGYSTGKTTDLPSGNTGTDLNDYAIWAGNIKPSDAPFWVKKDGSMSATNATFKGKIKASKFEGLTAVPDDQGNSAWLIGCGIAVGSNISDVDSDAEKKRKSKFFVDPQGNLTLSGDVTFTPNNKPKPTEEEMQQLGILSYEENGEGQLYINASRINTKKLTINYNTGGLCPGNGAKIDDNGNLHATDGIKMYYGSDPINPLQYFIITDSGVRMTAGGNNISVDRSNAKITCGSVTLTVNTDQVNVKGGNGLSVNKLSVGGNKIDFSQYATRDDIAELERQIASLPNKK